MPLSLNSMSSLQLRLDQENICEVNISNKATERIKNCPHKDCPLSKPKILTIALTLTQGEIYWGAIFRRQSSGHAFSFYKSCSFVQFKQLITSSILNCKKLISKINIEKLLIDQSSGPCLCEDSPFSI